MSEEKKQPEQPEQQTASDDDFEERLGRWWGKMVARAEEEGDRDEDLPDPRPKHKRDETPAFGEEAMEAYLQKRERARAEEEEKSSLGKKVEELTEQVSKLSKKKGWFTPLGW